MPARPTPVFTPSLRPVGGSVLCTLFLLHGASQAEARIPPPPEMPTPQAAEPTTHAKPLRPQGLPISVQKTRQRVLSLALASQYEALETLATAPGVRFVFHQGFERATPARYWRAEAARGLDPLKRLATLLRMEPARDQGLYVWPAAAVTPTPAALGALRVLYDPSRIQRYATEGYSGWRTGIDEQGHWRLFLRGT